MKDTVLTRAAKIGVSLTPAQADSFVRYHELLTEANRQFNLTRVPDETGEAVDRNYLDSIAPIALGCFDGARSVCDVGSGAGFPGIPLSIALPDAHFVLLDARDKRVGFLKEVIEELRLNAEALHLRAEDAAKLPRFKAAFDVTTARAVAAAELLAKYMLPLTAKGGSMLAWKGPGASEELAAAEKALKKYGGGKAEILDVNIPGRDWEHKIVRVRKEK